MKTDNIIYWKAFDYSYTPSYREMMKKLKEISGKKYASRIDNCMAGRAMRGNTSDSFYSIKNSDYEGSIALTMMFDGDLIIKVSTWIMEHRELFKGDILDVGCDNGLITCYLATMFPNSTVTGIDLCQEAINNSLLLSNKLGLKNVRFECLNIDEVNQKYDTVFSLRVMHENVKDPEIDYINDDVLSLGKKYADNMGWFSKYISNVMKDSSTYISIERIPIKAMELGWLMSLAQSHIWPELIDKIHFMNQGDQESFYVTIASKNSEPLGNNKILRLYRTYVGNPRDSLLY